MSLCYVVAVLIRLVGVVGADNTDIVLIIADIVIPWCYSCF